MSEAYILRRVRAKTADRVFEIRFEDAHILLDTPGPWNLKSWSVRLSGMDAAGTDLLDDCFYHGRNRLTLVMETEGGRPLRGEVVLDGIAVGPRSRARFQGTGMLEGFEAL